MPHARRARERVALDLRSLARDAERLVEATADDVTDNARDARAQLAAFAKRVKSVSEDWRDRGLEMAETAAQRSDQTIRENVYSSLAIAAGIGFLVALLMRRK